MSPELAQLYALRAQLDAIILGREAAEGLTPKEQQGCTHPEEQRRDATTGQGPRQDLCLACGATVPKL